MSSTQPSAALAWALLGVLAYLVFLVVQPFLAPLAWAAVLAVVAYPVHERLSPRVGITRAAALTTIAATIVVIVPAMALTIAFAREMLDLAGTVQQAFAEGRFAWVERAWAEIQRRVPNGSDVDAAAVSGDALRNGAAFLMAQSGLVFRNVAAFVVDLILALFATFFLLRDATPIMRTVRGLLPMADAEREVLIARTRTLISAGVTSAVIVAGLQGFLGGIAFAVVGLDAPIFWGVVTAFFCLVPLGAWVIWLPAAGFLAANGSTTQALVLAALGVGVVSMVDNIVRPALLSERAQMNGLVVFVSLLGGLRMFGLLGLVLGPLLVVTALAFVTTYANGAHADPAP